MSLYIIIRAMSQLPLKSSSFFLGSFFGSIVSAFLHVIFGVSFYEIHTTKVAALYLATHSLSERIFGQFLYQMGFVVVFAIPIFIAFFVVGYPLFLFLRNTRWFRLWLAIIGGAATGVIVAIYFNIPIFLPSDFPNYFWLCGVYGAISATVCWWFIHRSNPSFKRDWLKPAP